MAAPSADRLSIAACLLDVEPEIQAQRQRARCEPEEMIPRHLAFAEWMRGHARNPTDRLEVVLINGQAGMRWERLERCSTWNMPVIDTSALSEEQVARAVAAWCQAVLERKAPLLLGP